MYLFCPNCHQQIPDANCLTENHHDFSCPCGQLIQYDRKFLGATLYAMRFGPPMMCEHDEHRRCQARMPRVMSAAHL